MTPDIDHTSSLAGSIGDKIDGFFYRCLNDKDYTMVHLSAGFEAMLGYDADWFISTKQSFTALTHPDDLAKVDKAVADATSKGGHWRISYRLRAEIPGKFSALPTRAYAMYAPELKGNSDEIKLAIVD